MTIQTIITTLRKKYFEMTCTPRPKPVPRPTADYVPQLIFFIIKRLYSNSVNECDIRSIQQLKKHYPDQWQEFIQKTARVVFILNEKHSRCSVGYLKLFQDKNPNFALFSPIDSRFPRLKIAKVNCPKDFFARPQVK